MTVPAEAFRRFLVACLLGTGLGLFYGFLRPPRQKHPHLSDLIFLVAAFRAWILLGFGICDGDLRLGYTAGLIGGVIVWELTFGRLLRPVFSYIWKIFGKIGRLITDPLKIILKKFAKILNFLFATTKKWVTIKCKPSAKHRKKGRRASHGKQAQHLEAVSPGIPPQSFGAEDRSSGGYRTMYGDLADPSHRDP